MPLITATQFCCNAQEQCIHFARTNLVNLLRKTPTGVYARDILFSASLPIVPLLKLTKET